jgi:transcriptional regulator with XRE-family HTH domain
LKVVFVSDFSVLGLFRQKRHELGVSQEAFADLCELDRTYIGGIERGERNVALAS